VSQNLLLLLAAYLLSVALYLTGRLPFKKLISWYLFPVIYTLTIAALFVFDEPAQGAALVAQLVLRALAMVTYSLTIVLTTRYSEVTALADRLLPRPFDAIFLLTYHFIFVFFELMDQILLAAWARGGSLTRGVKDLGSLYARIFAYGVIFSFDKAERVGKAMEARGFTGSLCSYEAIKRPSMAGVFVLIISASVLVLIFYYQGMIQWP
jgi:cobalt/nickel transport system permease protein